MGTLELPASATRSAETAYSGGIPGSSPPFFVSPFIWAQVPPELQAEIATGALYLDSFGRIFTPAGLDVTAGVVGYQPLTSFQAALVAEGLQVYVGPCQTAPSAQFTSWADALALLAARHDLPAQPRG